MGYSPWGRKELDMTERLTFTVAADSKGKVRTTVVEGHSTDPDCRKKSNSIQYIVFKSQ